jgi:outer membrane lipoprotein-sorting protein
MRKLFKHFLFVSLFIFLNFTNADNFDRGLEIALATDKNFSGFGDSQTNLKMLLKNRKGFVTERKMKMKLLEVPNDGDKSLIVFDSPRDVRGVAVLSYAHKVGSDEQWLYLPALKRVKRVASKNRTGPFLGSEFSLEDLSFQEIEKYTYKYLRDEDLEGKGCYVIKRIPLDPYSGYTKQIVWIDKTDSVILQIHHYDRKSFHLKTQIFKGYKKYLNKFWRPNEIHMINHQTNKTTTLFFEEMTFNTGLSEKDFTQNSLKRSK